MIEIIYKVCYVCLLLADTSVVRRTGGCYRAGGQGADGQSGGVRRPLMRVPVALFFYLVVVSAASLLFTFLLLLAGPLSDQG